MSAQQLNNDVALKQTHKKMLPQNVPTSPSRKNTWFVGLTLLIAVFALILSAVTWYTLKSQLSTTMQQFFGNMQTFMQTGQKVNQLEKDVAQLQKQLNALPMQQKKLNMVYTKNVLDLAYFRLHNDHDVVAANYLLAMALNTLNADPASAQLMPVQTHIQQAIAQLALVPAIDVEKTTTVLDAIANLIANLPLNIYPTHQKPDWQVAQTKLTQANNNQPWWQNGFNALRSLIIIRRHDEPVNPLLAPPQDQYVRTNLQLLISQTEGALLQRNALFLQKNIMLLQLQLGEHFDLTSVSGKKVMQLMTQLIPLRDYINNVHLAAAEQELQQAQQSLAAAQGTIYV